MKEAFGVLRGPLCGLFGDRRRLRIELLRVPERVLLWLRWTQFVRIRVDYVFIVLFQCSWAA